MAGIAFLRPGHIVGEESVARCSSVRTDKRWAAAPMGRGITHRIARNNQAREDDIGEWSSGNMIDSLASAFTSLELDPVKIVVFIALVSILYAGYTLFQGWSEARWTKRVANELQLYKDLRKLHGADSLVKSDGEALYELKRHINQAVIRYATRTSNMKAFASGFQLTIMAILSFLAIQIWGIAWGEYGLDNKDAVAQAGMTFVVLVLVSLLLDLIRMLWIFRIWPRFKIIIKLIKLNAKAKKVERSCQNRLSEMLAMENEVKDISKKCDNIKVDMETRNALIELLEMIDNLGEEALGSQRDMLVTVSQSEDSTKEKSIKGLTGSLFRNLHATESRVATTYGEEAGIEKDIEKAVREILLVQSQVEKEGGEGEEEKTDE